MNLSWALKKSKIYENEKPYVGSLWNFPILFHLYILNIIWFNIIIIFPSNFHLSKLCQHYKY